MEVIRIPRGVSPLRWTLSEFGKDQIEFLDFETAKAHKEMQ